MTAQPNRQTFYRSYKFRLTEKDPVIDAMKSALDDSGYDLARVNKDSGVAVSTMRNWFDGPTRRPTHATAAAFLGAIGKEFAIVDSKRHVNGHALEANAPKFFVRGRFRSLPARS